MRFRRPAHPVPQSQLEWSGKGRKRRVFGRLPWFRVVRHKSRSHHCSVLEVNVSGHVKSHMIPVSFLSSFTVSFPQSWHTHPPYPGWWCWAESWPFSSELNSLRSIRSFQKSSSFHNYLAEGWPSHRHSTKHGSSLELINLSISFAS